MKTSLVHCELEGRLTPSWHRPLSHPKPRTLGCVFRASKRHEHARSHDGLDGLAHKEISPAAREVFKEAQENILALNGSRIRALQELKAANQKIAELEKKLEEAAKQLSSLAGHRPADGVDQQQQPSSSTNISSPIAAEGLPPPHLQQPPPVETITVCYVTGWEDVFLHYQIDDQPWTSLPGLRMEPGHGHLRGKRILAVPGQHMKFVVTNGMGKFDTPNPYGEPDRPKNYQIDGPGTYLLESGHITRLD